MKKWKSKKTLRIESQAHLSLWQEAEEGIKKADAFADRLMDERDRARGERDRAKYPRTLVLTPNHQRARHACGNLGIPTRGRGVSLVSRAERFHGYRLERGDRVVFVDGWGRDRELVDMWALTLHRSDLSLDDLWVSHQ